MLLRDAPTSEGLVSVLPAPDTRMTCCHYWIIEPAEGPVSQGVCQYCYQVKEFLNSIAEVDNDY